MYKVSVIIATHNRCDLLNKVLIDLEHQDRDESFTFDVIVVDNNSNDNTCQIVEDRIARSGKQNSLKIKYLFEPRQGKSYALNRAIEEAQGDIIAFTDDDVSVEPNWLMEIIKCFKKYDCDGVGGRVMPTYPKGTPQWIKKYKDQMAGVVGVLDYGQENIKFNDSMHGFIGANYAFKKENFDKYGMFRCDLGLTEKSPRNIDRCAGEDTEYIDRLVKNDRTLYYCGNAVVWHPVDLNRMKLRNLAKWHMEAGRFSAWREYEGDKKNFVYYFGIPRYLLKGVCIDFLLLFINVFHRRLFFNRLRSFFRKVGMISEYRYNYKHGVWCKKEQHG